MAHFTSCDLRPFSPSDAPEIIRWVGSPAEALQWASLNRLPVPQDLLSWQRDPETHTYILSCREQANAYGEIWVDAAEKELELARLIVAPARRQAGLGSCLVAALLDKAAEYGYPAAFVRVVPGNLPALRCYAGQGFRRLRAAEEREFNRGQPRAYLWLKRPF